MLRAAPRPTARTRRGPAGFRLGAVGLTALTTVLVLDALAILLQGRWLAGLTVLTAAVATAGLTFRVLERRATARRVREDEAERAFMTSLLQR
jgi:hypothetical protein